MKSAIELNDAMSRIDAAQTEHDRLIKKTWWDRGRDFGYYERHREKIRLAQYVNGFLSAVGFIVCTAALVYLGAWLVLYGLKLFVDAWPR